MLVTAPLSCAPGADTTVVCEADKVSAPPRTCSFVFFLPALKYFKSNLNVGEIREYSLIAKKIDMCIKFY